MALDQNQILELRKQYNIPQGGYKAPPAAGGASGGDWFKNVEAAWNPAPAVEPEHFKADGVLGAIQDVAHGAAKRGTESLLGVGHIGQKIQKVVGKGLDAITGDQYDFEGDAGKGVFSPTSPEGAHLRQELQPDNFAEKVGGGLEQAAEFGLPSGMATRGEKLVQEATKELPGIFGATARILGKSAVQGAAAGGVEFLDTGGDLKDTAETAALAGATRGVLATIGEGARALKIPERLYQTIFKNTKNDMLAELRSNAFQDMEKTDPELFKKAVASGIIKVDEAGAPVLNDTLAEKALDRSLRGSVDSMANQVVKGATQSEIGARQIAAEYKGLVELPEEQYQNVLREVADEYQNVGFGEVAAEATQLADTLKQGQGKVDATTALQLRRFFDRLRIASSYEPGRKLSMTQQNFKTLADSVRKKVNSIPGMGDIMKDYSFYIDALDALAAYAKRTGNNQLLGMIDSIFLGAGLSSGSAAPLFMGAARRALNAPGIATGVGDALKEGVMGALPGTAVRSASGSAAALDR